MKRETQSYRERITQDPNIMAGKPVVRGTRIPVERILQHLEETTGPICLQPFPSLPKKMSEPVLIAIRIDTVAFAPSLPGAKDAGLNQQPG